MEADRRQAYLDLIVALLEAPESEAEEILAAKPELVDAELLETMGEEAALLAERGRREEANWLRNLALNVRPEELANKRETIMAEKRAEAERLLELGIEQFKHSQYSLAIEFWQKSLKIYRQIDARQGEADSLKNLGNAYYSLGQYQKAIELYEQSLRISRDIGYRQGEANSLGNLGVAYDSLGQHQKAIEYHEQSLNIDRETGYRQGEANSLGNLGVAYYSLGQYQKAIELYEQYLKIALEIGDRQGEAISLGNLGNAYYSLGQYQKAIEYHEQHLKISREIGYRQGEAISLGNLGSTYLRLGQYQRAIEYHEQRLKISREIGDRQGEANSLGSLGNAYHSLGQYQRAIEYREQDLKISREIGDRPGEAISLGGLGNAYYSLGQYQKAIELYEQSLTIKIGDRQGEASFLGGLGNAYSSLGQYQRAIEIYEQYLKISWEIGDRLGEWSSLNNLGATLLKTNQLPEAEDALREAMTICETLRYGLEDRHKISIFETQANTYRLLQEVLVVRDKPNEALVIAERGRTRVFVELLRQRLSGDASGDEANRYINLEEIQTVAREQNATLVEYSLVNTDLYIWVIQPTGEIDFRSSSLVETLGDQDLETLVLQARASVGVQEKDSDGQPISRDPKYTIDREGRYPLLQAFYNLLIAPIRDLLPAAEAAEIILIPHYQLFLVPFAALQNPEGRYLLEDFTLRIAPSIQILQLTRERQERLQGLKQALVVGDPTIDPKFSQEPYKLQQLLRAREAAENIAQLLAATPLLGERATKDSVIDAMKNARIVQIIAHGLLDDFGSGIPGTIILAPSEKDNGALNAAEILPLSLGAEMVVLSACSSGGGKITGDGVIGLSRCFVLAGVPSLIVSLWDMGALAAKHLMLEFYQNLQEGQDRATALRQAMLDAKKEYRQPKAWAAFTLIGESDSLVLETQLPQEVLPLMSIPENATDPEVIETFFNLLETAEPELFAPHLATFDQLVASDSEAEASIARRIKDWCQSRSDVEKNLENEICTMGVGNKSSKPSDDVARDYNERLKENRDRLDSWSSGKEERKEKN